MSAANKIDLGKNHTTQEHKELPTRVSVSESHDAEDSDQSVLGSKSSSCDQGKEQVQRTSKLNGDSP